MDYNDTNAILTKDQIRYITQNITPEECEYVAGIKSVCNDCEERKLSEEESSAILYVTKLLAFLDKFRVLHWSAVSVTVHRLLDDFYNELNEYTDAISENLQSISGQFCAKQFTALTLPVSDNPLEVINELKQCVSNFLQSIGDNPEYEGCRNATSGFLETVHKNIYLLRLAKPDSRCDY